MTYKITSYNLQNYEGKILPMNSEVVGREVRNMDD